MNLPVIRKTSLIRFFHHYSKLIDLAAERVAPAPVGDTSTPDGLARGTIMFGAWMMILVVVVPGLWAGLAPLDSAAVALGNVTFDSNRKTIQHLEGGVVDEILVRDGSQVKEGDPLIRLNPTASKARLNMYQNQYVASLASEARLLAERDGLEKIAFPKEIEDQRGDSKVAEVMKAQENMFNKRHEALVGQVKILEQKKEQSLKEIDGLTAQVDAATQQIAFLDEEIKTVRYLLEKGNAQKPRLLALQRQQAQLKGERGANEALIARAQQTIAETELQIGNVKNDFQNKVAAELKDTQSQSSDSEERVRASADVMGRVIITSPVAGIVTGLKLHSKGAVIPPGGAIMDIVPLDDKLVIDVQVALQDIDVVHSGLKARVRLSAYKSRNLPAVEGTVVMVSPDRFIEERTNQSYYKARVEIPPENLAVLENVHLTAGMPAEVYIITGTRTLLQYLISPISDSFHRAFREQ